MIKDQTMKWIAAMAALIALVGGITSLITGDWIILAWQLSTLVWSLLFISKLP